jgi:hypothetical protein
LFSSLNSNIGFSYLQHLPEQQCRGKKKKSQKRQIKIRVKENEEIKKFFEELKKRNGQRD